jgi:hypothetical protein
VLGASKHFLTCHAQASAFGGTVIFHGLVMCLVRGLNIGELVGEVVALTISLKSGAVLVKQLSSMPEET